MKPRHIKVGVIGEDIVEKYLKTKGHRVVGRNVRVGKREIDIVSVYKEVLHIIEVKTSRVTRETLLNRSYTPPSWNMTSEKISNIHRAARQYITKIGKGRLQYAVDFVLVLLDVDTHSAHIRYESDVRETFHGKHNK